MRLSKACFQCRSGKRKCSRTDATGRCDQCISRAIDCSLGQRVSSKTTAITPDRYPLPALDDVINLVELYFCNVHDQPHSLFHCQSIRDTVCRGTTPRALLFAILALGAGFSSEHKLVLRGPEFAEAARYCLKRDLENICMSNVQACILITEYAGAHSDRSAEAMYSGIATRMVQLLQLDTDPHNESAIESEIRKRVWSSCYMMDIWSSAGLGIPKQLDRAFRPQSLMPESDFQDLESAQDITVQVGSSPGLWVHMISLVQIFTGVQDFHKRLLDPLSDETATDQMAADLSVMFDRYLAGLPKDASLTDSNLENHVQRGSGQTLIALHLGYHHYATLLYFPYLERAGLNADRSSHFADRCKHHAASLSDIIKLSMERPSCEAQYHIVGHMTTISSSVLLYTLLFGGDAEVDPARARLHVNFAKLMELSRLWPGTDRYVSPADVHCQDCQRLIMTRKTDSFFFRTLACGRETHGHIR